MSGARFSTVWRAVWKDIHGRTPARPETRGLGESACETNWVKVKPKLASIAARAIQEAAYRTREERMHAKIITSRSAMREPCQTKCRTVQPSAFAAGVFSQIS